jgi:arylsulfatase A-like enzyme
VCTAVAVVLAKVAALLYTFQEAPVMTTLRRVPSVVAYDLLLLGLAGLLILPALRIPGPRGPWRLASAAILYGSFSAWTMFSFANTAFFMTLGSSLDHDLLRLAPDLARYFLNSITAETVGVMVTAGLLAVAPLLLTPSLCLAGRGLLGSRAPRAILWWAAAGALLAGGLVCAQTPPHDRQEKALRNMTIAYALLPASVQVRLDTQPPSAREGAVVRELNGPIHVGGQAAFGPLARRRYNVLLVVWESVGERYLRDHHPLGVAPTPVLRSLEAQGSVRFSRTYAECPLSVQSIWALLTGLHPPGKPQIFLAPEMMPPHGPLLAEVLKAEGYRTAMLIGSYTRCWRADRVVRLGGFDAFEDIESMANRDRFAKQDWSIDGRALNDRLWGWLDEGGSARPFFAVVWNVETHYPYRWPSMSQAERDAETKHRYTLSIEHADRLLGEIEAGLRSRGLREDTLLVVLGDHGEGTGRAPHPDQRLHGVKVYEDSLHVPLVFLNPSLERATTVDTPSTLIDLYPTLLDLVGVAMPPGLKGVSLAGPVPPRSLMARGIQWWPVALRAGRYKLIQAGPDETEALYDLEADPTESNDLAEANPEIVAALRAHILYETAQRRRFDASMDTDRRGLQPEVPPAMVAPP